MREISVADYFVEFLISNGVTDVFGYQGGMIAYIFDSLGKYKDKINYHSCATEQGAALAACSYAQASGKLGVAISTSGPGFTNMVTGIANAWFDSIPVLFVSGNVNTKDKKRAMDLRQLGFQEIQAAAMAKNVTKVSFEAELDTDYIKCFNDLYTVAMSGRKGPVYLDLPINVCRETVTIDKAEPVVLDAAAAADITAITEALAVCSRPAIIAGAGIAQAGCRDKFRDLINTLGVPVVCTLPAVDVLPTDSKYMMGYIGGTARREAGIALQNADCVISIGTRLCSKQVGHNLSLFAPRAHKFIRIDIDNTELERKLRNDEIQIKEDIRSVLAGLLAHYSNSGNVIGDYKKWSDNCAEMKQLLKDCDMTCGNKLFNEITEVLPENANIILDVGKNMTYGGQSAVIKEDSRMYMSAGLGAMGYAIPAAIGAVYGSSRPTYAFTGDGGAQMNIQELNTIAKNKLPVKMIVFNNQALGNIRIFQELYLDSRFVATGETEGDYFSCDFKAIAEAYGIQAYKIGSAEDMRELKDKLYDDKACLFEIVYNDCPVLPGIVAGGDFLKENSGLDNDVIERIKQLMQ